MTWIATFAAVYAFIRWMVEDNDHDKTAKAYLTTGAALIRAEQRITALEAAVACRDEEISNLEATVDHLRRGLLRAVEDEPVPFVPTPIYDDLTVERAAASLDDEWAELNGGDSA